MPKVSYCSVFVDDQERALGFYRDVLGFEVKHDVPMGEHRWLTLTGPGDPDGAQILLEPAEHPAVKPFRAALVEDGIPATAFEVDDVAGEIERLRARGVTVVQPATPAGPVTIAVVDDTCGNLIQLFSA